MLRLRLRTGVALAGIAPVLSAIFGWPLAPAVGAERNPCLGPDRGRLLCPDLVMARPSDVYIEQVGAHVRVHASSLMINRGRGPAELFARRVTAQTMSARQRIYRVHGRPLELVRRARLRLKYVPGYGRFWKWRNAARFELWSLDRHGRLDRRVRQGGKQVYCLRDFTRVWPFVRHSPVSERYPACSENPDLRHDVLGLSPGWGDYYPYSYPEQYIDATGLHGRFALAHVADPTNVMAESDERNNRAWVVIRLR